MAFKKRRSTPLMIILLNAIAQLQWLVYIRSDDLENKCSIESTTSFVTKLLALEMFLNRMIILTE